MKITYYTADSTRYHSIPKEISEVNFATIERAFQTVKSHYKPFQSPWFSIKSFSKAEIWQEKEVQVVTGYRKYKKEQIPIYETQKVWNPEINYHDYNTPESEFLNKGTKGFFKLKIGDIKEEIEETEILWSAPVLVQFWSADRIHTPEIKKPGEPYQPEKKEIVNQKAISDWIPVYYKSEYRENNFYLDKLSGRMWDNIQPYLLHDSIYFSKNELEILE